MRAIYPGTFDPVTYGHLDLIRRARAIFSEVIVAVAHNSNKTPLFSVKERVELLRRVTKSWGGVTVDAFNCLVVDYARRKNSRVMIRGLRMLSDFEYEFQMALTNRRLSSNVETIFMMPSESYAYLSARLIKEAGMLGADLSSFVPPLVAKALHRKFSAHNPAIAPRPKDVSDTAVSSRPGRQDAGPIRAVFPVPRAHPVGLHPAIGPGSLTIGPVRSLKRSGGRDVAPLAAVLPVPRVHPVGLHKRS